MRGSIRNKKIKAMSLFIGCMVLLTFMEKGLAFSEETVSSVSGNDVGIMAVLDYAKEEEGVANVSDNDIGVIADLNNAGSEESPVTVSDNDTGVIPDLYNTGATEPEGGFTVISTAEIPCTINGEQTTLSGEVAGNQFKINLKYKNSGLDGTIVIENVDLSEYSFVVYSMDALKENNRNISFVFNNCKMRGVTGGRSSIDEISFVFNNCSFLSAYGSDMTFNHCRFGGGINDRLNLFVNCFLNDCYIYNPTSELASEGDIHVDGIQIYGNNTDSTIKTENIHFDNCRFEMPALRYPNAPKTYVNACIMLQTEFSDGDNISFENCYVNGGGFSIYAHGTKGTKLSNVSFKNLHFGCAAKYGRLYPDKPETDQVEWNEDTWEDASSIYVGTVQRDQEKNETYICVSNDTNQKRYFRAYTSSGRFYDYSIEACPTWKEFNEKKMAFEEFPFDRLYTIPEYCDWVVVYEMLPTANATLATMNQVRVKNWTDNSVALGEVSAESLTYELSEEGTLTVSGFGNMPEFSSEESIPWYGEKEKIKKIIITGVTSVSNRAFSDCINLEEVVVEDSFEKIEASAFSGCIKLSELNLNQAKELKTIGANAFFNCISLSKVTLPEGITSVESDAFSIDTETYEEVQKQTDVYYDGGLTKWLKISFANPKSNPMYMTGGNLYVNGSDLVTELSAKDSASTYIGGNVFAGCLSLTKVDLTDVTEIGAYAFAKSNVSGEVVIPQTVKKFGTYAFSECTFVEKLIWKSSNAIAMGAFQYDTGMKEVVISGNVTSLSNWAFEECSNLTKVTLPDTMVTIAQRSFHNCSSLKEINIPTGVTNIGNSAFSGCTSLEKIALPDSVKSLGLSVFYYCSNLKEIRLSEGLTDLGTSCLSNCKSLETVRLPESLTSISASAFNGCSNLKTIRIPASVTEIKTRAFYMCNALSSVYFSGMECPTIVSDTFGYITAASVLVYIPENAVAYTDNTTLTKIAGHLYSTKVVAAINCIVPGKEQYTCLLHENCESNYEKLTQTLEHQPGKPVSENVVPATTEKEGSCDEVYYCSVCNKELSRQKKVIAKLTKDDSTNGAGNSTTGGGNTATGGDAPSVTNQNQATDVAVASTSLKKAVNKKSKKIEVTWKKAEGVAGYEIQYSTNKNFKKGVRTKKVTGASKGKVTIKGLKMDKKYYVRIRAYKYVDGVKYVSKWSKKKSVKILR